MPLNTDWSHRAPNKIFVLDGNYVVNVELPSSGVEADALEHGRELIERYFAIRNPAASAPTAHDVPAGPGDRRVLRDWHVPPGSHIDASAISVIETRSPPRPGSKSRALVGVSKTGMDKFLKRYGYKSDAYTWLTGGLTRTFQTANLKKDLNLVTLLFHFYQRGFKNFNGQIQPNINFKDEAERLTEFFGLIGALMRKNEIKFRPNSQDEIEIGYNSVNEITFITVLQPDISVQRKVLKIGFSEFKASEPANFNQTRNFIYHFRDIVGIAKARGKNLIPWTEFLKEYAQINQYDVESYVITPSGPGHSRPVNEQIGDDLTVAPIGELPGGVRSDPLVAEVGAKTMLKALAAVVAEDDQIVNLHNQVAVFNEISKKKEEASESPLAKYNEFLRKYEEGKEIVQKVISKIGIDRLIEEVLRCAFQNSGLTADQMAAIADIFTPDAIRPPPPPPRFKLPRFSSQINVTSFTGALRDGLTDLVIDLAWDTLGMLLESLLELIRQSCVEQDDRFGEVNMLDLPFPGDFNEMKASTAAAGGPRALCFSDFGISTNDGRGFLSDVSAILSPTEICHLLTGVAQPPTYHAIRDFIQAEYTSGSSILNLLSSSSQLRTFFTCLGDIIDTDEVCQELEIIPNIDNICLSEGDILDQFEQQNLELLLCMYAGEEYCEEYPDAPPNIYCDPTSELYVPNPVFDHALESTIRTLFEMVAMSFYAGVSGFKDYILEPVYGDPEEPSVVDCVLQFAAANAGTDVPGGAPPGVAPLPPIGVPPETGVDACPFTIPPEWEAWVNALRAAPAPQFGALQGLQGDGQIPALTYRISPTIRDAIFRLEENIYNTQQAADNKLQIRIRARNPAKPAQTNILNVSKIRYPEYDHATAHGNNFHYYIDYGPIAEAPSNFIQMYASQGSLAYLDDGLDYTWDGTKRPRDIIFAKTMKESVRNYIQNLAWPTGGSVLPAVTEYIESISGIQDLEHYLYILEKDFYSRGTHKPWAGWYGFGASGPSPSWSGAGYYGDLHEGLMIQVALGVLRYGPFSVESINKILLTPGNEKCAPEDVGDILDLEGIIQATMDEYRSGVCAQTKPDPTTALKDGILLGIIKGFIQVQIVHQILKNIFVYSIYDIADTLQNSTISKILVDKVRVAVEGVLLRATGQYRVLFDYDNLDIPVEDNTVPEGTEGQWLRDHFRSKCKELILKRISRGISVVDPDGNVYNENTSEPSESNCIRILIQEQIIATAPNIKKILRNEYDNYHDAFLKTALRGGMYVPDGNVTAASPLLSLSGRGWTHLDKVDLSYVGSVARHGGIFYEELVYVDDKAYTPDEFEAWVSSLSGFSFQPGTGSPVLAGDAYTIIQDSDIRVESGLCYYTPGLKKATTNSEDSLQILSDAANYNVPITVTTVLAEEEEEEVLSGGTVFQAAEDAPADTLAPGSTIYTSTVAPVVPAFPRIEPPEEYGYPVPDEPDSIRYFEDTGWRSLRIPIYDCYTATEVTNSSDKHQLVMTQLSPNQQSAFDTRRQAFINSSAYKKMFDVLFDNRMMIDMITDWGSSIGNDVMGNTAALFTEANKQLTFLFHTTLSSGTPGLAPMEERPNAASDFANSMIDSAAELGMDASSYALKMLMQTPILIIKGIAEMIDPHIVISKVVKTESAKAIKYSKEVVDAVSPVDVPYNELLEFLFCKFNSIPDPPGWPPPGDPTCPAGDVPSLMPKVTENGLDILGTLPGMMAFPPMVFGLLYLLLGLVPDAFPSIEAIRNQEIQEECEEEESE